MRRQLPLTLMLHYILTRLIVLIKRETLYGTEGDHHEGFDHVGLFDILNSREKWVLSYNDCDYIRKLYNEYKIVKVQWAYGMNKSKESSEILILG